MAESATLEQPQTSVETAPESAAPVVPDAPLQAPRLNADEALNRIFGNDEPEETPSYEAEPATGAPTRDEKGRFLPKTQDQPETPVSTPDSEPAAQVDTEPDGYEKALGILRRAKVSKEFIDSLPPAQAIVLGAQLAEAFKESDGFGNKLKDLEKENTLLRSIVKPGSENQTAPKPNTEPVKADSEPGDPLDAFFDPINFDDETKPFAEYFDETMAGHLKNLSVKQQKATRTAFERLGALVAHELTERDNQTKQILQFLADKEKASARRDLSSRYEHVKSDDGWEKALVKARALLRSGSYSNLEDAFEDAARLTAATPNPAAVKQEIQTEMAQKHAKRAASAPTVPTAPPSHPRAKSMDALKDDLIDAIEAKNAGVAGAAQKVQQIQELMRTAGRAK